MKNLFLTAAASLVLSTGLVAQPEDSTIVIEDEGMSIVISGEDIQIDGMSLKAMLTEFKTGMEAAAEELEMTLEDIETRAEAGEITEEQAELEREEATEKFEMKAESMAEELEKMGEAMETRAEATAEYWEEWGEQWEESDNFPNVDSIRENAPRSHHLMFGEDGIYIEDRVSDEILHNEHDGYIQGDGFIGFHIGLNQLLNENYEMSGGFASVKPESSLAVDLELGHKFRLGTKSPVFLQYGVNFAWRSFQTRGSLMKVPNADGDASIVFDERTDVNVSKTEFDISYLDIPVMLSLDFSGKDMDESFTLGVGGYGGIRMGAERETRYTDFHQDEVSEDIDDNFLTNQFRYGVMAQIGWGSLKLTAKYDLNTLFNQTYDTPDYQVGSVTLGVML